MKHGRSLLARALLLALPALAVLLDSPPALAQEHDADELAKKLSNPISSLISVPFQFNPDFNIGTEDGTRTTLYIQPVIPVSISKKWNLVTRIIAPVTHQDDIFGDSGSQFGLGDITPTFFFSPKAETKGGIAWGAGPVLLLPTATDDLLGSEKWGGGPSFVVLKQTDSHWTYGVLMNQIWGGGGEEDRDDVSRTFIQPFLSKGLGKGRTLAVNSESVYDWNSDSDHWTVPINFMYSAVTKFGKQMASVKGGVRYYPETAGDGPDWGLRFEISLLFPK